MKLLSLSIILLASTPLTNAWLVVFSNSQGCRGGHAGSVGDEGKPLRCTKLDKDQWSAKFKSQGDPYNIVFWKGKNCDGEYYTPGSAPHSCSDLDGMHSYAVLKRK